MEINAFIHFSVNTFTDVEYGTGDEDPDVFNPTELDPSQWARVTKEAGMGGLVLVAKHHDGFALWPSSYTQHSVAYGQWRGGRGDLVRETATATHEAGLDFGIYLSPYDLHDSRYGTQAYNDYFMAQIYELTGPHVNSYGQLFEFWLDGFGGVGGTTAELPYPAFHQEIRRYQPGILIAFSRDIDWSGTEAGEAPETYWNARDNSWIPIECDMPFRPGWFWHPNEDPKPLEEMVDVYFRTVGRDCVLLLGLAPDRRGLIEDEDVRRLQEWRQELDRLFETNVADNAPAVASSTRPGSDGWSPGAATDGEKDSFWAANEATPRLEVDLGAPRRVSIIEIGEPIRYGQRIEAFHVEAWDGTAWREVGRGTTVGRRRLLRIAPVVAQKWRLVIDGSRAVPAVHTFALYAPPLKVP